MRGKIIIIVFILLFLINSIFALDFDNVKEYNPETKTVTITNSFGLGDDIANIKLLTPVHNVVPAGDDVMVAEIEIDLDSNEYINALKQLQFYDLKIGMREQERSFVYKIKTITGTNSVNDYGMVCSGKYYGNGTEICNLEKTGSHLENTYEWNPIGKDLTKGKVTIGIFTDVESGEYVEWIPTFFGVRIEEWADFLGSTLYEYYNLNDDDAGSLSNVKLVYQTFTVGTVGSNDSFSLVGVSVKMYEDGGSGMTVSLFDVNSSGDVYTNSPIVTNGSVDTTGLPGSPGGWINVTLPATILTPGSMYALGINGTGGGNLRWRFDNTGANYSGGTYHRCVGLWNNCTTVGADKDVMFEIWGEEAQLPPVVTLNNPPDYSNYTSGSNITFNCSATDIEGVVNLSLIFNNSIELTITNSTPNQNLSIETGLIKGVGYYNWTCLATDSSLQNTYATGRNISLNNFFIDSEIYNATTYQTSREKFFINISSNGAPTTANFIYDGTNYSGTKIGNDTNMEFSYEVDIPSDASGNKMFYWEINNNGSLENTTFHNQTVNPIIFRDCNGTTPYVNFTFKDEVDNSYISAFTDSSTWVYWIGTGIENKTFTYSNSSSNPEYTFCLIPEDRAINVNAIYKYSNSSYPQRTFTYNDQILTNATTNKILYLLSSTDGIYSSIQTTENSGAVISGVEVTIERQISGVWTIIGQSDTGDDGLVTFWVNPNYPHRITAIKSGYITEQVIINPSQSTYTIVMGRTSGDATYEGSTKGMRWIVYPGSGNLQPGTYTFNFNLTSTIISLDGSYCKLELVEAETDVILSSTTGGSSSGCNLSIIYAISEGEKIRGKLYVDTEDTTGFVLIDGDAYWISIETDVAPTTIFHFLDDLKDLPEFGEGLRQEYSRVVFFFFFVFLLVSILSFFTGYDRTYPGSTLIIVFCLIWLASFAGWFEFAELTNYSTLNKYSVALITSFILGGYIANYYNKT